MPPGGPSFSTVSRIKRSATHAFDRFSRQIVSSVIVKGIRFGRPLAGHHDCDRTSFHVVGPEEPVARVNRFAHSADVSTVRYKYHQTTRLSGLNINFNAFQLDEDRIREAQLDVG